MIGEDQEFRSRGGQRPNGVVGCRAIVRLGITACDSLPIAVPLDTYAIFEVRNWNVGRKKDVCATGDCVVHSPDPARPLCLGRFETVRQRKPDGACASGRRRGRWPSPVRAQPTRSYPPERRGPLRLFSRTGFRYLEHHEALAFTMGERAALCLERVMLAGPPQNTFPSLRCVVVPFSR